MFGFLKNKISGFINGLIKQEEGRAEREKEFGVKLSVESRIRSFLSEEVEIKEKDVKELLENLELSLLEGDVAYSVAQEIISKLRNALVGKRISKKDLNSEVRNTVRSVLLSILQSERGFDFVERVRSIQKPVKILFVGPNGSGKTTTMAKIAKLLMKNNLSSVFAASDTFRAAAIEQTAEHAGRLGIKVIKSKYGADPASVAFDAVNYAKAHGIDVVLIDSAGRQETNVNLIDELKKINRVIKPDLKIYVGESIAGNAVLEQIGKFNDALGIDGAVLTKLDCDAKGGTALSISKSTGVPIIFIGVGQGYEDLEVFDPERIVNELFS